MSSITKIYTFINNKILFNVEKKRPSVKEQIEYLNSFPEPKDEIENSFFKYKCLQFYSYTVGERILINFISFFAIIFLIPFYRIRGGKYNAKINQYNHFNRLLRSSGLVISTKDIFPVALEKQFDEIVEYDRPLYFNYFITKDAFDILKNIISKYPTYFHFQMVVLIRLSQACFFLYKYNPCCVTTYVCERRFADPIITMYYESHLVKYHGFMHGDYLWSIDKAFMHFSKYWIWEEHYERMFNTLRCKFETEIYLPRKYSGIVKPRNNISDYDYYATYYFSGETRESIDIIRDALTILKKKGYQCKVRPHPRFSNIRLINDKFGDKFVVEDVTKVTIEQSLECSYLTVALASTVLSQAYYSGKKIVIDDISNVEKFLQLHETQYILIDKADMLLSELLNWS